MWPKHPLKRLISTFLLVIVAGLPSWVNALEIVTTGVDEVTQRNILNYLGKPTEDTPSRIRAFIKDIPSNADKAMQSIGYYNAKYDITRSGTSESPIINVAVTPGPAVTISNLTLTIEGDARLDGGYMPVIARIPIRLGSVFTHAEYEGTKAVLFDAAQDRGYFDFDFIKSGVRISRRDNTADITLIADSSFRYTFAEVTFDSEYFDDQFLRRYVPFEVGDFYESAVLAQLTQQMQNTGFFSKVRVIPKYGPIYGKQVPIFIEVERKDKNYIGVGAGFATDTLWRTKFTWNKPLVNKAGHSFDSELGLSKVEQNVSFQYRIPRTKDPLTNYWSVEYGLLHSDVDETESTLSTLNFQHARTTSNDWRESLFIRWERERSIIGGVEDELDLVLPGVSYSKNKSVGTPFPTAGYNANFRFLFGSQELLSDIDFYKSVFSYKTLKSFGEKNTFILSLQYGAIESSDFDRLPASQRFFAGGDRTIRGFDYRSVSPKNPEGVAVGGRYLEVTSLEYNYRFLPRWAGAVFVDAGRAFNNFDQAYSVGAGVGIRWLSPVGPFRVDFARSISEDEPDFTFHLSLGPDL